MCIFLMVIMVVVEYGKCHFRCHGKCNFRCTATANLPWQMSFPLYRTENPSTNDRPFVIIPIQMRMETHIMIGDDEIVNNTEIILRSGDLKTSNKYAWSSSACVAWTRLWHVWLITGSRGASRHLSRSLRNSGCFFIEIVIDTELSLHTLFQSAKNTKITIFLRTLQNHANFSRQIRSADNNTGDCQVEMTKCAYSHEFLIRDIKFTIPSATLENFVLTTSCKYPLLVEKTSRNRRQQTSLYIGRALPLGQENATDDLENKWTQIGRSRHQVWG